MSDFESRGIQDRIDAIAGWWGHVIFIPTPTAWIVEDALGDVIVASAPNMDAFDREIRAFYEYYAPDDLEML